MSKINNKDTEIYTKFVSNETIERIIKGEVKKDDIIEIVHAFSNKKTAADNFVKILDLELSNSALHTLNSKIMENAEQLVNSKYDLKFTAREGSGPIIRDLLSTEARRHGMTIRLDDNNNIKISTIPPAILDHYSTLKNSFYQPYLNNLTKQKLTSLYEEIEISKLTKPQKDKLLKNEPRTDELTQSKKDELLKNEQNIDELSKTQINSLLEKKMLLKNLKIAQLTEQEMKETIINQYMAESIAFMLYKPLLTFEIAAQIKKDNISEEKALKYQAQFYELEHELVRPGGKYVQDLVKLKISDQAKLQTKEEMKIHDKKVTFFEDKITNITKEFITPLSKKIIKDSVDNFKGLYKNKQININEEQQDKINALLLSLTKIPYKTLMDNKEELTTLISEQLRKKQTLLSKVRIKFLQKPDFTISTKAIDNITQEIRTRFNIDDNRPISNISPELQETVYNLFHKPEEPKKEKSEEYSADLENIDLGTKTNTPPSSKTKEQIRKEQSHQLVIDDLKKKLVKHTKPKDHKGRQL